MTVAAKTSNIKIIIRGYVEGLGCPTLYLSSTDCFSPSGEPCSDSSTDFICNMTVTGMDYSVHDDEVTATFNITDLSGYLEPLTYLWEFDTAVFVATSPVNQSTITLKLIQGKQFPYIVTPLTLTITDANRCKVKETCYLVNSNIDCTEDYVPCTNPRDLKIINKYVQCSGPSGLLVKKK